MLAMIGNFLANRSAATAVEYGLIVAVLSLAIVGSISMSANAMVNMFDYVSNTLEASP